MRFAIEKPVERHTVINAEARKSRLRHNEVYRYVYDGWINYSLLVVARRDGDFHLSNVVAINR